MAGDWIKMRIDLADDPSVVAIAESTGLDEFGVVGRLHKLWSWADRHSIDGNALSVTGSWLDRYVSCDGFAAAMTAAQWLRQDGATLSFPNFERHNGEPSKKRALTNKRVADHREMKRAGNATCNAESNADSVTESVTREEKRREETTSSLRSEVDPPSRKKPARAVTADWKPSPDALRWCAQQGIPQADIPRYVEAFRDSCTSRDARYADHDAAFRNSVRSDWGKVRQGRANANGRFDLAADARAARDAAIARELDRGNSTANDPPLRLPVHGSDPRSEGGG